MTVFDRFQFREAIKEGGCNPPNLLTPLVRVSRSCYSRLHRATKMTVHEHYEKVAERMPMEKYGQVRMAADRALRCAHSYFPAYSFHVGEFINDEWLSTVDWDGHRTFHRDHVLHQLLCVYVGSTILKGGSSSEFMFNNKSLADWCVDSIIEAPECSYLRDYLRKMGAPSIYFRSDNLARRLWSDILEESLFLAANYHDIGYPWQFVSKIQGKLDPNGPLLSPQSRGVDWIHDHYRDRLLLYPLRGYQPFSPTLPTIWTSKCKDTISAALSGTHGLPGALAMLHLDDSLRQYPTTPNDGAVSRFCVEWAAMAIMMHDMQKFYEEGVSSEPMKHLRVSLTRDPLSFLLTLIDQIQDFGRFSASFFREIGSDKEKDEKVHIKYDVACHRVEIVRQTPSELAIKYYFKRENDFRVNDGFKKKEEKKYFDPRSGYLDYSALPISRIRLLAVHDPDGKW